MGVRPNTIDEIGAHLDLLREGTELQPEYLTSFLGPPILEPPILGPPSSGSATTPPHFANDARMKPAPLGT